MTEHTSHQQPDSELINPPQVAVDMERFVDTDEMVIAALTVTREDGSKLSLFPMRPGEYFSRRSREDAQALRAVGIQANLLPSDTDAFTADEERFAHDELGLGPVQIKHPFMSQFKPNNPDGREVIFFKPTVKSMFDVMRLAGHDNEEIREARLAALQDRPNPVTQAMDILLTVSTVNDDPKADHPPYAQALKEVLGSHARTFSTVEAICEKGIRGGELGQIRQYLHEGLQPDLIREIAQGDERSNTLVRELWKDAAAYALDHNRDQQHPYVEIHKLGDQYIPLPALFSTAWQGSQLGFVDETSGHTLADIYHDSYTHPDHYKYWVDEEVRANKLAELSHKLGLSQRTVVARGRYGDWKGHGKNLLIRQMRNADDHAVEAGPHFVGMAAGLSRLGVPAIISGPDGVKTIEYAHDESIGNVTTNFEKAQLGRWEHTNGAGTLMILSGLRSGSDLETETGEGQTVVHERPNVALTFLEGNGKRHEDLYREAGLEANQLFDLTLGDTNFRVMARCDAHDLYTNRPRIAWFIEATQEQVEAKAADLAKIIQASRTDMDAYLEQIFSGRLAAQHLQVRTYFSSNPDEKAWDRIRLLPEDYEEE